MARHQAGHRMWFEPGELIEQIEQRELNARAEEQADIPGSWLEIDDDGRHA
ncbi:MAG: hypothetical protein R2708_27660 [Vicinamibacterales bacterium]